MKIKKFTYVDLILTSGADKVTAALLSGDAQIGLSGSEATIYVYNGGEKDYLKTFSQLTQKDGTFLVSREKYDNFKITDVIDKSIIGGRAAGMPEMTLEYILKQNGLDHKIIAEYIAGNQENFKQVCVQIFGENFNNYFNSISSRDNEKTEQMLIELITNYIKGNGLNISNYWGNNSNQLAQDNLYFKGSPTLSRAVVNCGIESFKPEEQNFYKYF